MAANNSYKRKEKHFSGIYNMLSLLLRNLFFTLLQPGIVAGLVPYWILRGKAKHILAQPLHWQQYTGALVCLVGFMVMLSCIINFAVKGRGTLSPADPTKHLVISGLYKHSRNPMYIGVTLILVGEAIFFKSAALWKYVAVVFATFYAFILLHEEPRLKKDFGESYLQYCKKVRRWI